VDIFPYYCCLFAVCIPVVKAPLNSDGLQLVEVEKYHLIDLHDIVEKIYQHPGRFILYCGDDLCNVQPPPYDAGIHAK